MESWDFFDLSLTLIANFIFSFSLQLFSYFLNFFAKTLAVEVCYIGTGPLGIKWIGSSYVNPGLFSRT